MTSPDKVFAQPSDLPPQSQRAWRELVTYVKSLGNTQDKQVRIRESDNRAISLAQTTAGAAQTLASTADAKAVVADEKATEAKQEAVSAVDQAIQASLDADKATKDAADALVEVENSLRTSLDQYVVTNSATTPPGPGAAWSDDTPDWEPGQYVWRRQKNTAINGNVTYSAPSVITGADGTPGEDAVLLRISSSRGTSFKNNAISTILQVTVFKGSLQIKDISTLWAHFGVNAYLEWWWRREDDSAFGVISSSDGKISEGGFALTVSPDDVDEQTVFQCILNT